MADRYQSPDRPPARVLRVDRGLVSVLADTGTLRTSLGADLLDRVCRDPAAAPCAGDWCELRRWPDGPVTVERVLPRTTSLVLPDLGGPAPGTVLAANIDLVLGVVRLVPAPSTHRVERLLTLARSSGARAAIVLTRADLVADPTSVTEEISTAAPGVPVVVLSSTTGVGLPRLRELLGQGTAALIGTSGAGKSTLVKAMVGTDVLVSGRCELVPLPGGGAVIDMPALRAETVA